MGSFPLSPSFSPFRVYRAAGPPGLVYTTEISNLAFSVCLEKVAELETGGQCGLGQSWRHEEAVAGSFCRRREGKSLKLVTDGGGVAEHPGETQATL